MNINQQIFRNACDTYFKPSMVNDWEDEEALLNTCKKVMDDNDICYTAADEDDWLEFVYRAQELCEINEKGYCYRHIDGDYRLVEK